MAVRIREASKVIICNSIYLKIVAGYSRSYILKPAAIRKNMIVQVPLYIVNFP
jgi:hypothetical protein